MKTSLKEGHYYSALTKWNGIKVFFEAHEIKHYDSNTDSVFLIFPPEHKGGKNKAIYHWPVDYFNDNGSEYIKENTAQELTKEELLQIILETGWETSSKIF